LAAADALGVATARLPIQEYVMERHTDHILNVNTVVEVYIMFLYGMTVRVFDTVLDLSGDFARA
jgi:hypothetical protein